MKIVDVNIRPLASKHYSTDLEVTVLVDGNEYTIMVSIAGYTPHASHREKARGWEPDWGMDHTESETHLALAHLIAHALADLTKERSDVTDEQKARIVAILQDCEEYFDNLADAWTEDGYWVQNEEKRLLHEVGAALDILGNMKGEK